MGVGMQITYLGFAGSAPIEAEAGMRLVRLERFREYLSGCHLIVEAVRNGLFHGQPAGLLYDARLDLITRTNDLIMVEHGLNEDPGIALQAAFDAAERRLEQTLRRQRS
ncbi:HPF/RaiA family ribosome-associated protein [Burkholderia sp. 4M9327F10]|uniref:HPF/RaiA family ribosome-associated protein n=1 Tax=Burkholderia sp. 4M9327F10 TaxID=2502223 RepID=UPI0010F6E71D|nr:HPF/RaiA family ribosome-associated protein [Burkholderia sp. 4M9327F10]